MLLKSDILRLERSDFSVWLKYIQFRTNNKGSEIIEPHNLFTFCMEMLNIRIILTVCGRMVNTDLISDLSMWLCDIKFWTDNFASKLIEHYISHIIFIWITKL